MNAKTRATELFMENLELSKTDQTAFRRKVMHTLIAEFSVDGRVMSIASAATLYNNAKKAAEQAGLVQGLGRTKPKTACSTGSNKPCKRDKQDLVPDDQCYTVLELVDGNVGRCRSFLSEEDAREHLRMRRSTTATEWKLIQGLGPNSGDVYRLGIEEKELD